MNTSGRLPTHAIPTALVAAAHVVVLWWLIDAVTRAPVIVPPRVIASLMSEPVVEPVPLPVVDRPVPLPIQRQIPRPRPVEPPPIAAPSERAVTAPPAAPPAPAEPVAVAEAPPVPVAAPPPPAPKVEPVVPPRSDAAHLNNPAPTYPAIAKRMGEQGRVLLDVYILADGSVGEIKLKRTSGSERLDRSALEAVRAWRFVPAKRGGEPINFWYVQPIDFALQS